MSEFLDRLAAKAGETVASSWPGAFHVCDACGFRWHENGWPHQCPNCKRGSHWLASHPTELAAAAYVPLRDSEPNPVIPAVGLAA